MAPIVHVTRPHRAGHHNDSDTDAAFGRDWTIRLAVAVLAGVIAALLGPYTTYNEFSFPQRLLYWGGLTFALLLPAVAIRRVLLNVLTLRPFQADIVVAVVQALLFSPAVWVLNIQVMEFDVANLTALAEHFGVVLFIFLLPVVMRTYLRDVQAPVLIPLPLPLPLPIAIDTPFLRRLDPCKRGAPLWVSADGHQLLVGTTQGESRIRMRFSDALDELEDFAGVCIHRSHRVTVGQISTIEADGRRHVVHLTSGGQLPVSKTGAKALRQAGFEIP